MYKSFITDNILGTDYAINRKCIVIHYNNKELRCASQSEPCDK